MKKIILIIISCLLIVVSNAQKKDTAQSKPPVAAFDPKTDSIPPLAADVNFINNNDLVEFIRVLKLVMSNEEYKKAGDPISQYELIINNTAYVFGQARQRWELKNKIKKPVK